MTDLQSAKALVREFHAALDRDPAHAMRDFCAPDALWRGFHPFNEIRKPAAVADTFWIPLQTSLTHLQRRMDVFMAGDNGLADGGTWVSSMGHLIGLFDAPLLGIPPTGKIAMLRYAEFLRVEAGRITDTAMFFDLPHLMLQAGVNPFPPQTGAHLVQPGPATHDGLMYVPQDPAEGQRTLDAIERMIGDLRTWKDRTEGGLLEELPRSWHDDMIWWGPAGIGATYTIERYARQHAGPFRQGFADRSFNGHVARIAEGHYGGFFGWPNLTLRPSGGFMGMPGSEQPSDMRVIDIYRRDGDRLAENWIFIDMLHYLLGQGLDVLARLDPIP
ncbi:nuclear transport factor 2 family protein [Sulfitobacter sp. D35]|uniref:nuclear transport factor 2 family protein n=1 Tax=Sulfitobacter sp. D35 TaxID=3083252 RepID=UPI00296E38F7|nr:nuclear transport factor 2 family protein [Sulfitobacter sp. D35]MDW4499312.1 nuclear transport factor 2 family protein [Sulfitobacter sp. D35]